jgi:flagellin-specific chaperone FliS
MSERVEAKTKRFEEGLMHAAQQQTMPLVERGYGSVRVHSALNTYRNEQMMNLSPVEVIHKLYAVGIHAINELIAGLNFEYQEVALTLYRLYQYAKHCLRMGKYNEAAEVLEELRSAWGEAFKL